MAWTPLSANNDSAARPAARAGHGFAAAGGKLYVHGGYSIVVIAGICACGGIAGICACGGASDPKAPAWDRQHFFDGNDDGCEGKDRRNSGGTGSEDNQSSRIGAGGGVDGVVSSATWKAKNQMLHRVFVLSKSAKILLPLKSLNPQNMIHYGRKISHIPSVLHQ
jgi:hypothetical protein